MIVYLPAHWFRYGLLLAWGLLTRRPWYQTCTCCLPAGVSWLQSMRLTSTDPLYNLASTAATSSGYSSNNSSNNSGSLLSAQQWPQQQQQ